MTPERTRLLAEKARIEAELAKLDAEPDWEAWRPALEAFGKVFWGSPTTRMIRDDTKRSAIRGLIAAAPLIPRDAGMTDDGDDEGPCTDCWDTGETQNERECPCGAGRTAPLMPVTAMTDAEIEARARELSKSCSGETIDQFVEAVIRETLSRVQPQWPSEEVQALLNGLAEMPPGGEVYWRSNRLNDFAAIARRIRSYQTGEQA